MLKFLVFHDGRPATDYPVQNAYLLGAGNNAMRGRIVFESGVILCEKREQGCAAFALNQSIDDCGELVVQTCLLPDRPEPYILGVELARHRLMLLYSKLEEWSLFDLPSDHPINIRMEEARRLFIGALCAQKQDPADADQQARQCLSAAVDAGEELALLHSETMLARKKAVGALSRRPIGCGVGLEQNNSRVRASLQANFDFLHLPLPWKKLAPEHGRYQWSLLDGWAEWIGRNRAHVVAGPVISFDPRDVPGWLYKSKDDYSKIRDAAYEYMEGLITRMKNLVTAWDVVSGLHVNQSLTLNFEQILEITRMCSMLAKKIQPIAKVLVELREPFGEYYSINPRSIPPMIYADLLTQSGTNFDGFIVKLVMGRAAIGQGARDLLQVSMLLDQYALLGKPLHILISAPSDLTHKIPVAVPNTHDLNHRHFEPTGGYWRRPWSSLVQSSWAEAMFQIALSKPMVESVAWSDIIDHPDIEVPGSGLINNKLEPQSTFGRIKAFRRRLLDPGANALAMTPDITTSFDGPS
jgi:hypothetical protein